MPLSETGQILVSQAAARQYAEARGLQIEEARRELTALLAGAKRGSDSDTGAERWRARSRTLGVDVSAMVSREGGLAVVTYVHVRRDVRRSGQGAVARRAERRKGERG